MPAGAGISTRSCTAVAREGQLYMTFVENPLMRFMWLGGAIMVAGTSVRLWPSRRRWKKARPSRSSADDGRVDLAVSGRRKVAA